MRFLLAVLFLAGGAAFAQEPPEAVYRKMHNAMLGANLREMTALSTEARKAEIANTPGGAEVVRMVAAMMPRSYTVTGTSVSADGMSAQLRATGTGSFMGSPQQMHGVANFFKEKGEWKVDRVEWGDKPGGPAMAPVRVQQKPRAAEPTPAPPANTVVRKAAPPPDPMPEGATHRKPPPGDCVIKPVMTDDDLAKCR